jgi:hypothetical protein
MSTNNNPTFSKNQISEIVALDAILNQNKNNPVKVSQTMAPTMKPSTDTNASNVIFSKNNMVLLYLSWLFMQFYIVYSVYF